MDVYSWDKKSLVSSMVVKQAMSGQEALIFPQGGLNGTSKFTHLSDAMRKIGLDAEPRLTEGNVPALRVRGFENPEQLLDVVAKEGFGRPASQQSMNTASLTEALKASADMAAAPKASRESNISR